MKQILIFGDSILKGVTYNEAAGRHKLLPGRFSTLETIGHTVKNCSIMGATVTEGRTMLQRKLTDPSADTTVLLEYGGNDCDHPWSAISDNPAADHQPKTPLDCFIAQYGELINYARSKGAAVYICNLVPLDADKYIRWISRNLNYDRILGWLGDTSMLYRWQEHYSRATEKLAEAFSCPLIDLRKPFLLSHRYQNLLSGDGIHPTEEGHRLVEKTIAEALG